MLLIYQNVVDAVAEFVKKRWPDKMVYCQEKEKANHENRYIQITTMYDPDIIHYEYINGYLELHLESEDYYENPIINSLYKYLRKEINTSSREFKWHRWFNMTQGLLRYETPIENELELGEAIALFVNMIDPLLDSFKHKQELLSSTTIKSNGNPQQSPTVELETKLLSELFSWDLRIPSYQRIYCWPQKNVELLLDDIFVDRNHPYHLGTVILQCKNDEKDQCYYDIIDGQQRLVTLALVIQELHDQDLPSLLDQKFESADAQRYIAYNRYLIRNYINKFCADGCNIDWSKRIKQHISFDVLILKDSSLDLAYTFFSSQNSRGKALTDYELLKSHHLRYIPDSYASQQRHLAKNWDSLLIRSEREDGDKSVSTILGIYLYCLRKWTRHKEWYINEPNRVKNEFEAAPIIEDIPPFGEKFEFMDPIQGGAHFFSFVNSFIQHYHQFITTRQFYILWSTISCSGLLDDCIYRDEDFIEKRESHLVENKNRTHWWYGDVIATFLFAYYLKFGNQYLAEALTCITRIVSQLRYKTGKANKQSLLNDACGLEIIDMINQATSPTFFLAEAKNVIRKMPVPKEKYEHIRKDFYNQEMALYNRNKDYYSIQEFNNLHNYVQQ